MRDGIDTLRAADPAALTAGRSALDGRAQAELHALLAERDDEAGAPLRRRSRRRPARRWAVPGAAAAAVAVLLTGTLGGAQIAALRGDDPARRSALVDQGGGSGGAPDTDADTASRAKIQATLDAFRAAKAKATPPYVFGAPSGRDLIESQLRLDREYDPAVAEAVRAGRLRSVLIQPGWVGFWEAFRTRAAPDAPRDPSTGVAPTNFPKTTRVQVTTATGILELDGLDLTMGHEGSGVHLLVPVAQTTSYVDLRRTDPTSRPAFVQGHDPTSRRIEAFVIEDENATRGEYRLEVREEPDVVVVSVRTIRDSRPTADASAAIMRRTRSVYLAPATVQAPLGNRPIVDAATGSYVDSAGW